MRVRRTVLERELNMEKGPPRRRRKRRRALGAAGCLSAAAAVGLLRSSSDSSSSMTLRSTVSDRRALRRGLQTAIPQQCYDNILSNPTFATGSYAPWQKHSVIPDFTLQTITPGYDGAEDFALEFGDRYSRYQGVRQSILSSADCLLPSEETQGDESFYLTISYDVAMLDPTNQGIATCTTDRVTITESDGRTQLSRHSCPWIELVGRSVDDPTGQIRAEVYLSLIHI